MHVRWSKLSAASLSVVFSRSLIQHSFQIFKPQRLLLTLAAIVTMMKLRESVDSSHSSSRFRSMHLGSVADIALGHSVRLNSAMMWTFSFLTFYSVSSAAKENKKVSLASTTISVSHLLHSTVSCQWFKSIFLPFPATVFSCLKKEKNVDRKSRYQESMILACKDSLPSLCWWRVKSHPQNGIIHRA